MLTFTIIILICILVLGVSLLASHWNSGAKRGETVRIDALYKRTGAPFLDISTCGVVCFGYCLFVLNVTRFVCR